MPSQIERTPGKPGVDTLSPLDIVQRFSLLYPGLIGPLTLRSIAIEAATYRRIRISNDIEGYRLQPHDNCVALFYLADIARLHSAELAPVVEVSPVMAEQMIRLGGRFVAARGGKLR